MSLSGHKNPETHMRYVALSQNGALEIPAGVLPMLPAWSEGNRPGVATVPGSAAWPPANLARADETDSRYPSRRLVT
jgi:hypothetical protein